ncbi:MAG: PspC domain-containing protein [Candidatus Nanopelagicales bacterium]
MTETQVMPTQNTSPPRQLRRSSSNRVFGGVSGGLGEYWNIDPVIIRVLFAVSILVSGIGLIAYLAFWLFIPLDSDPNPRPSPTRTVQVMATIGAFLIGLVTVGAIAGQFIGFAGVLILASLAALAVWIVLDRRTDQQPEVGYAYGGAPEYAEQVAAQPRQRSYLGLIALCAASVIVGVTALITQSPVALTAAPVLVLGIALIVGAFWGRARWLLFLAVPLLILAGGISAAQNQVNGAGGVGDRQWSVAQPGSYSLFAGTAVMTFDDWDGAAPQPPDTVSVNMTGGELVIEAPRNWDVALTGDVQVGSVTVDGETVPRAEGSNLILDQQIPARAGKADGVLTIDVNLGVGEIRIDTTGSPVAVPEPTPTSKALKGAKS